MRGNASPSVIALQNRLAAHGFDPGVRHGFLDFRTRGSVAQFQHFFGLRPTVGGVPDAHTIAALNAPSQREHVVFRQRAQNAHAGARPHPTHPPVHHSVRHPHPLHMRPNVPMAPIPQSANVEDDNQPQPFQGVIPMSDSAIHRSPGAWNPTGLRVPLVLAQSIPAATSALVSQNPQMDFRGENFVIDTVVVGPNCTVTVPTVGTTPQVAGGPASTGVPGAIFSPSQNVPLDFSMMISNQGNAVSLTVVNTLTSLALAFAALLFGHEVSHSEAQNIRQAQWEAARPMGGMAPAGSFGGMAPAGTFGGAAYGGRGGRYFGR